jgi:monoamine oxidase
MSTIVIGAGPAGLEAARTLTARGEDVVVLEANAQVGGRTRSDRARLLHGQAADLGGSFIDIGQDKILDVCAQLGVALTPECSLFPTEPTGAVSAASPLRNTVVLGGRRLDDATRDHLATEVRGALIDTPPEPTEPVLAWAVRSGLSEHAKTLLAAQAGYNPVSHPAQIPMAELHPPSIGKVCWMMADGTDSLVRAMARGLDIRFEQPVRRVEVVHGGVDVETDRDRFTARDVIVTAPIIPTLGIGFDPVLPDWKQNALRATQMSQGGKVIGQYSRGAEIVARIPHAVLSDGPVSMIWAKPVGPEDSVVVLGLVPDMGEGTLRDEERALQALDELVRTATGVRTERLSGILQDWTQDEYAGGVVSLLFGDRTRLQALLAQPVGRIHFAGEHTADIWANAIDGALRSGERAADEVLQRRLFAAGGDRIPVADTYEEI